MSIRYIGPVPVDYRDPNLSWTSAPDQTGNRTCQISGMVEWPRAKQLSELVANSARRVTIGADTGVLEYIHADGLVSDYRGWYLLQSFDLNVEHRFTIQTVGYQPTPFSLSAVYLGDGTYREVVVSRSARPKTNAFSLVAKSVVADPFWSTSDAGDDFLIPPGGSKFTREFDPSAHLTGTLIPSEGGRAMTLYGGTVNGSDALAGVVHPVIEPAFLTPAWVSRRGGDVRAYDRRAEREVYGPHSFQSTTDCLLTNGLVRLWVGNAYMAPFVSVWVFKDDAWRHHGYVAFDAAMSQVLVGVRLTRVTPDSATIALAVSGVGEVFLTLNRGDRAVQVQHGSRTSPRVLRRARWVGLPVARAVESVTLSAGLFGSGALVAGQLVLAWPQTQSNAAWSMVGAWTPQTASASLADSGLGGLQDQSAIAGSLVWEASTKTVRWTLGANTLATPALTFVAGAHIRFALRFSTTGGMSLTVWTLSGGVQHVTNAAYVDRGSSAATYASIFVGSSSTPITGGGFGELGFGEGDFGGGGFGPGPLANGRIDNLMIFEDRLTDPEAAALVTSSTPLGGLPTPEGRLVWYVPFDSRLEPLGSTLATGRRYESTTDLGATRTTDSQGLTKGLVMLDDLAIAGEGLSIEATTEQLDLEALLATTDPQDDIADYQQQFAATRSQQVRVRA